MDLGERTEAAGPVFPRVRLTFAVEDRNPNLESRQCGLSRPQRFLRPGAEVPDFPLCWGVPPPSQGL